MIDKIAIKNFRGLENFEVNGLGKFNIFVGENGVGKTTILEALFVGLGSASFYNLLKIQNFRLISKFLPDHIQLLFFNLNTEKPISFEFEKEKQTSIMKIYPLYEEKYSQEEIDIFSFDTLDGKVNGLKYVISNETEKNETKTAIEHCILMDNNGTFEETKTQNTETLQNLTISTVFVPSYFKIEALRLHINEIRNKKQNQNLIEYLQKFEPRFQDIETREDGVFVALDGIPMLININFLGEGFKKYTHIIALILANKNRFRKFCVCIDEIENSLHPKTTKQLLKTIEKLSDLDDVEIQFFITTHSLEFLEIARENLSSSKIFKIALTPSGVKSYPYSQEGEPYFSMDRIDPRGWRK